MMHKHRRWCVSIVATPEELARMLAERTWTLCSGFSVAGHEQYVFLNDATSEDGAGEYGVIRIDKDTGQQVQVESITFSWCTVEKALAFVQDALAGRMDSNDFARKFTLRLETPATHQRCHLCA